MVTALGEGLEQQIAPSQRWGSREPMPQTFALSAPMKRSGKSGLSLQGTLWPAGHLGTLLYPQLNQHNAMVKAIPVRHVEKGQLLEYILTDLRVPHSYEIRLTPYTTFGAGDMASRIIHYTERR